MTQNFCLCESISPSIDFHAQVRHCRNLGLGIEFKDELEYVESSIENKLPMFRVSKDGSIKEEYNRSPDREIEKKLLTLDLREGFKCQLQGIINLPKVNIRLSRHREP